VPSEIVDHARALRPLLDLQRARGHQTAKVLGLGPDDAIVTVATDGARCTRASTPRSSAGDFGGEFTNLDAAEVWGEHLATCPRRTRSSSPSATATASSTSATTRGSSSRAPRSSCSRRRRHQDFWRGLRRLLPVWDDVTLGLELAEQHAAQHATLGAGPLAHVAIQIGGGALATGVARGLGWAVARGVLATMPAIHAVQTAACFPLVRAWRRVARGLTAQLAAPVRPADDDARDGRDADAATARWLHAHAPAAAIDRAIAAAAADRAAFMWPWETPPHSIASGILDDETYDWLAIVRAMLAHRRLADRRR
jgi:hypothetical protein